MFNVLVIAYYYPPMGLSGVQRTLKFTKYMGRFNWKPTVITSGRTAYFAHDLSLLKEAEESDIEIIRTEAFDPNSFLSSYGTIKMPSEIIRKTFSSLSKTIFIPDNKISWAHKAYLKAKEIIKKKKFDIIFVTVPPFSAFMMAAKLKKEFDIPLFVDYRDLWFGNQFAFYPTSYHKYRHKLLEDSALRATDKIVVVNRKIKESLLKTYQFLKFEDITIIPHGFDPADYEKITPQPKSNNKLVITYSGIFYENITPKYLLLAFHKLQKEKTDIAAKIELQFIGHFRKENRKLVKNLGLEDSVKIFGYIEHLEALTKVISSDILWVMLGNKNGMENVSAGKFFEYIGSKKPIVASVPDGATKNAAIEYGASFITGPENVEQIKNTLKEVYNLYINNKLPVPSEEFISYHNRILLTEKLTKEFQFFLKEEL